jgi:glycosidase
MQGQKPDPAIREPMPWTGAAPNAGFTTGTPWEPLPADSATINVADETGDPASLLSLYRTLIRLREGEPALQDGATATVSGGADSVIGILRSVPGRSLLLVVNVSDRAVTDYGLTLRGGPLCGGQTAHVLFTAGIDPATPIAAPALTPQGGLDAWRPFTTLPPLSAAIVTLEPAP